MSAIEETKTDIRVQSLKPAPVVSASSQAGASSDTASSTVVARLGISAAVALALMFVAKIVLQALGLNAVSLPVPQYVMIFGMLAGATYLILERTLLDVLSSVRFGVMLLCLLVLASMVGMLVMQVNVEGFDRYFAELTPAQKLLWGSLGFFDIYHVWYFNVLLLVLSLNIVLASIDRFPKAWTFISRPKLDASAKWLSGQSQHAEVSLTGESGKEIAEQIAAGCRAAGLKKAVVTEKGSKTFVFAERNAWNRLGAYAVHVSLLTVFTGGFLTAQFSRSGSMPLRPGMTSSEVAETVFQIDEKTGEFAPTRATLKVPFEVTATDIQQIIIRKDGPITADNTIDWMTRIRINDGGQEHDALVQMNRPHDHAGYRFFQASFISRGMARNIKLLLTPEAGGQPQEVSIRRDGEAALPDGTKIKFEDFFADFTLAGGQPATASGDYNNPAALLSIQKPGAPTPQRAYAFAQELPSGTPIGAAVAGYKFRLAEFEKVPDAHILAVQKDPGATVFYVGSAMLIAALLAVFLFSHQRFWAVVEDAGGGNYQINLGANTNRNLVALEDRFKKLVSAIKQ
ncbi:MAG: cytochrome c biogenesis protein ResB [Pyrinomonadaceae bacterium]